MALQFGIFDHLDDNGIPLADLFETRLKLIEQYDRSGFRSYHIAEHHSTPLGMAPSPSVFLAAVAQRTKRLRFGPLLYVTPMYHPLRVAEEVVMLDHMSRGRLELGLGRGASPIEIADLRRRAGRRAGDEPRSDRHHPQGLGRGRARTTTASSISYKNVRIAAQAVAASRTRRCGSRRPRPSRAADAAKLKGNIVTLIPDARRQGDHRCVSRGLAGARQRCRRYATHGRVPPCRRRRERCQGARHRAQRLSPLAPQHGVPVGMGRPLLPDRHDLSG